MEKKLDLATEYAERIRAKLGPEVKRIILFGSRARGDAAEGSDYDCIVVVKRRTPRMREAILDADTEMLDRYDQLFAALLYSEEEWQRCQKFPLAWNVKKEGIPL